MNASVGNPTPQPPTAPAEPHGNGFARAPSRSQWTAATDNVGVARYNVHRGSTTPGFTPTPRTASRSRPATSYTDTGLAAGTYYYKVTAEDAAGNVGAGLQRGERAPSPATYGRADRAGLR